MNRLEDSIEKNRSYAKNGQQDIRGDGTVLNRSFDVSIMEQSKRFDGIIVLNMKRESQTNRKHRVGL